MAKNVPVATEEDVVGWLTKGEVMKLTGLSDRTVDRRVEAGELQMAYSSVPGRRARPLYHPGDVQRLIEQPQGVQPYVAAAAAPPAPPAAKPAREVVQEVAQELVPIATNALSQVAGLLSNLGDARKNSFGGKTYLTLDEAIQFTGLPRVVLIAAATEEKIQAIRHGRRWFFQRAALESF